MNRIFLRVPRHKCKQDLNEHICLILSTIQQALQEEIVLVVSFSHSCSVINVLIYKLTLLLTKRTFCTVKQLVTVVAS